jgi:hypothetical protein
VLDPHEPRPVDEAVLGVLRDVIGEPALGPGDDFYLAGGHSLLVMRVVRRLRVECGLELAPRAFAMSSQIAALIAACRPADDAVGVAEADRAHLR